MKKEAASGFFKRMTGMKNFDFPIGLATQRWDIHVIGLMGKSIPIHCASRYCQLLEPRFPKI